MVVPYSDHCDWKGLGIRMTICYNPLNIILCNNLQRLAFSPYFQYFILNLFFMCICYQNFWSKIFRLIHLISCTHSSVSCICGCWIVLEEHIVLLPTSHGPLGYNSFLPPPPLISLPHFSLLSLILATVKHFSLMDFCILTNVPNWGYYSPKPIPLLVPNVFPFLIPSSWESHNSESLCQ